MAQVNAGRVRFVSRGEYNNSTQYYLFDLVNYEGSSYVAIGNTLGNIPTNTTYWQLVAEKGNTGSVGPEGPQGVGIASITKTSTEGLVDTYTITYTDGTTTTFQVTNGEDGETPLSEFNALKSDVEDLRDNQIILPTEGSNIHVDDAAKARLYEFEMTKESTQETTTGKNLLNILLFLDAQEKVYTRNGVTATINNNGTITLNGTATANSDFYFNLLTINGENKKLVISNSVGTFSGTTSFYGYSMNFENGRHADISSATSNTQNLTAAEYRRFEIYARSGNTYNNAIFELMVVDTSLTDLSYEEYTGGIPSPNPDYPQEVKTVKGYSNLFDESTLYHYTYDTSTSKVIKRNDRNSYVANVKPNTDYVISRSIATSVSRVAFLENFNNENEYTYISLLNISSNLTYNITTPQNCNYVMFLTGDSVASNLMLVEGNQELPYVPYGNNYINVAVNDGANTNNYPIPLNNNELVGIGDYKDELLVDKSGHVFINKKTGKKVLTGSNAEGWATESDGYYGTRNEYFAGRKLFTTSNQGLISNYFKVAISGNNTIRWRGSNEYNAMIKYNDMTSLENFKNWLSTHNTDVYYVLAQENLIDLQTTVDLKLFKGVNNVSNSEDGNMSIRYVESIDSLVARVVALEEAQS